MKKLKYLQGMVVILIFAVSFTGIAPPAFGQKAGDKLAEVFLKDIKPPEDPLPAGITVAEGFQSGPGESVGTCEVVHGTVLVIHQNAKVAYKTTQGQALFQGDTLITREKSSLQAKLNDKSIFALAPQSKLVIDKQIYDPEKDKRESLLSLAVGKARFIVTKLIGSYDGDYKVRTVTAVCGTRGSDFAVSVVSEEKKASLGSTILAFLDPIPEANALAPVMATTLLTGQHTVITFQGTVGPTQVVGPLSASVARTGGAASAPAGVSGAVASSALSATGPSMPVMSMPPFIE